MWLIQQYALDYTFVLDIGNPTAKNFTVVVGYTRCLDSAGQNENVIDRVWVNKPYPVSNEKQVKTWTVVLILVC